MLYNDPTCNAYDTDNPARPALIVSLLTIANSPANRTIRLPIISSHNPSHLKLLYSSKENNKNMQYNQIELEIIPGILMFRGKCMLT